MSGKTVKVLLVEDNLADARMIRELISEAGGGDFQLAHVPRLGNALTQIAEGGVDLILLDLGLPDGWGLDTLARMLEGAKGVPIVVLTETNNEGIGMKAVHAGAQDYLVKRELNAELLVRAIRYAVERHQLQERLWQQHQQQQQEIRFLEQLWRSRKSAVTAETFGLRPIREGAPDIFDELVKEYGELLDLALERRAYKVNDKVSEALPFIADRLGYLGAGPRDVIEIHAAAVKRKHNGAHPQKARAYIEEGRLVILELMGRLVLYYRRYFTGGARATAELLEKGHPRMVG
ncbi:MAG: response regulator [Nitrospinota bacterium]